MPKWNLLRRIEHGNTAATPTVASALRPGHRIAVWWEDPDPTKASWYTAKVLESKVEQGQLFHSVRYDSDTHSHAAQLPPSHRRLFALGARPSYLHPTLPQVPGHHERCHGVRGRQA